MGGISSGGVPGRIMPAIALVLLTFNFSSHSFYQPISAPRPGITAEKAFAAAALRIGWIVCVRAHGVRRARRHRCRAMRSGVGSFVWIALVVLGILPSNG
jgi:hypothetical protein